MRRQGMGMRMMAIVTLCAFLVGCMETVPKYFHPLNQVFPPDNLPPITPQTPNSSYKRETFDIPYEDVYRAANMAVSQAQINIKQQDKGKGVILGERYLGSADVFYAVKVKELGPKSTEVLIMTKAERTCRQLTTLDWITSPFWVVFSLGLGVFLINQSLDCSKLLESGPYWANGQKELEQFQVFLRNNLIAAGLL